MFFLRLRKNERTRCSFEKAIAAEGKRWVGVLMEEAWRLFLHMRHRAVPYQGKPKSVVAVEGSRAQRRILARSGLARYSAPSLKEKAAVRLQTTWNKIHQQWVALWMDTWYNKQFTTNHAMCLLDRLNMGGTLLKYERTVATALLCHTAWHTAMPGQAFAEEFCEGLLSSLVTKKGQNRGAVTIEDVDDLYHLITIRKEGHRVNVCKIPNSFVNSVRQRLTAYLNAERVYVPWVR